MSQWNLSMVPSLIHSGPASPLVNRIRLRVSLKILRLEISLCQYWTSNQEKKALLIMSKIIRNLRQATLVTAHSTSAEIISKD
jgi:hypothetical protein